MNLKFGCILCREIMDMTLNYIWWSSDEYGMPIHCQDYQSFSSWSGVTYKSYMYRSNKSIWKLTILLIHESCPVGWGCRIHRLLLCRGVRPPPPTGVLDMTLNNLMVRFQKCWSFGECRVPLHCHRSQVHSGPEW